MRLLCLSNPVAGFGKGKKATMQTLALLHQRGVETELIISEYPGHFLEKLKEVDLTQNDGIAVIGGDGTLFETVNGIFSRLSENPIPIGVIPVGTGNSFARELFVRNVPDAVALILKNTPLPVDVGYFKTREQTYYFMNMLGLGFVSDVCEWASIRKQFGRSSYILGVIVKALSLQYYQISIVLDGKPLQRHAVFVEICNTRYTGGTMLMAPQTQMDDGMLDVVILKPLSRLKLLRSFPKIFSGTHLKMEEIEAFQCKELQLQIDPPACLQPDGEILNSAPITVGILPGKINVFR